ncbi:TlpA family protein disulfide reductase [Ilumatobacter sp.]|uniref:TlpA family protein disulfide reductase n=1 Tax=Ilumatobacter sp. TaxID=1967498 RepID=UPI003B5261E4
MTTPSRSSRTRVAAGLAALALCVGACGSDDTSSATTDGDASAAAEVAGTAATVAPDTSEQASSGEPQQTSTITVSGEPLATFDDGPADAAVGTSAPIVEGESFDGTPVTIGGATGSATMVVFLAHWCPHCNDEVPVLVEMSDSGTFPDDVDVVAVSTAVDPSQPNFPPSEWLDSEGWPWRVVADDTELSALRAFGAASFPFTVVLDAEGTVLARRAGEATAEQTTAFLDDALASAGSA